MRTLPAVPMTLPATAFILALYATTSDYLETIVDFDQPILAVGPGVSPSVYDDWLGIPMDRCVIWLLEKLLARQGSLDIFDLPTENRKGGHHDIDYVRSYLHSIALQNKIREASYQVGDISSDVLPPRQYKTIWDHGTVALWDAGHADEIIANFTQAIQPGGRIILAGYDPDWSCPMQHNKNLTLRAIEIKEDMYKTALTASDLRLNQWDCQEVWQFEYLFPHRQYPYIVELTAI